MSEPYLSPPSSLALFPPQATDSDIHELYDASLYGEDRRVRELLEVGADPQKYKDEGGNTALHIAACRGRNDVISTLIKSGADLNIQNNEGDTALHRAASTGNNEVATNLIMAGADLNKKNKDGDSALDRAASTENKEVLINLITAGAELNYNALNSTIIAR